MSQAHLNQSNMDICENFNQFAIVHGARYSIDNDQWAWCSCARIRCSIHIYCIWSLHIFFYQYTADHHRIHRAQKIKTIYKKKTPNTTQSLCRWLLCFCFCCTCVFRTLVRSTYVRIHLFFLLSFHVSTCPATTALHPFLYYATEMRTNTISPTKARADIQIYTPTFRRMSAQNAQRIKNNSV